MKKIARFRRVEYSAADFPGGFGGAAAEAAVTRPSFVRNDTTWRYGQG
jgi:hypothetical protein